MPSTNKTPYLSLNQWTQSDRPMRNDFNSDNATVDAVLGNHVENGDIHVTAEEKKYLKDFQQTFMYSGTGESSKTYTFTEAFRFIAVFAKDKPLTSGSNVYTALGYVGLGASAGLSISASGTSFTVSQGTSSGSSTICLNESGVQYRVIMFK